MSRFSLGLRGRQILLVMLAIVPALMLTSYNLIDQRQHAAHEAETRLLNLAKLIAQQQGELIDASRLLLIVLAQMDAVAQPDQADACHALLARHLHALPVYTNFGVADLNGQVYCSALSMQEPIDIADRSYFVRSLETRGFSVGDYQVGRITGVSALNFGYPVLDDDGNPRGVIYAAASLAWLERMITSMVLPAAAVLTVVDSQGTILMRYPGSAIHVGSSLQNQVLLDAIARQPGNRVLHLDDRFGTPHIHAFAPLHNGPDANVYVSIGMPRAAAVREADATFRMNSLWLLLVMLLTLGTAWVGGELFLLRPVRALTSTAHRLAASDFSARTGLHYRRDELAELVTAFDDMADALQRSSRARQILSAGNRTLVRASDESALLHSMCRLVVEIGSFHFAWIGYTQHDDGAAIQVMAQAGQESSIAPLREALEDTTWNSAGAHPGPAAASIASGTLCIRRGSTRDLEPAPGGDAVPGAHYALAAFPLRVQESIIGTFVICSLEEEAFDASEVEILAETAEDLAYGIGALRTRIEHEQAFRHIQHMLYHDSLTDLPNHAFLVEHVDRAVPGASRHQGPLALLLIGLSRFQEINGVLGFAQGDILLKEVTTRLHGQLDAGDLLVRMRGDEFAVLLPMTSEAQLIARALHILEVIGEPFTLEGLQIVIGGAIGIAHAQLEREPAADLIRHADIAMHQAKQQHKDYVVYTSKDDEDSTRNLAMAGELRHAIRAGQLVLHYQPKIDMSSGTPCGAEALVRWMHPAHGLIPPDEFVPMAERIGLINVLTDWVIAAILQQSAAWRTQGIALPIAANLSVRNLQDQEFPRRLDTLLETHRAAPDWLDFEITESAVMEDPHTTLQTLDELSRRGHALSIDDFGTGYSSLSYLQKMPVTSAKIDKSFVFNMLQSSDSAAIVRATILLAHDLKLGVVAEGVETQAMWDELARLGCDVAQGYFISRPVPAEEFTQFMARHAAG